MAPITCHILDTTTGCPASNVTCKLYHLTSSPNPIATSQTNSDGRIQSWNLINSDNDNHAWILDQKLLKSGIYMVKFETSPYFVNSNRDTFFPYIDIVFNINQDKTMQHYHIPLLLSNYGYSTYRGS